MCQYLLIFLLTLASTSANTPLAESPYQITTRKSEDTVEVLREGGSTVLLITSESGIGGATIKFRNGKWPAKMLVRLRYTAQRPFTDLESFIVRIADKQAYSLVKGRLHAQAIEIELPRALLHSNPQYLELEWVDFFR